MNLEIERKFLVDKKRWNDVIKGRGSFYRQGYLLTDPEKTVRIRVTEEAGFITIKGKTTGASRPEFEYMIPRADAMTMLDNFCSSDITKVRYEVTVGGKLWEVDEFSGSNSGLILAEIELEDETEMFELPQWATEEVTDDERYYNARLSIHPFNTWTTIQH